jgi:hypothetical protein
MKKLGIILGVVVVIGVLILILVAVAGGSYNRMVKLSQGVDTDWKACCPMRSANESLMNKSRHDSRQAILTADLLRVFSP